MRAPVAILAAALGTLLLAAAPAAAVHQPWPPRPDGGVFFVHYGEEHHDDDDGMRIFPKVIEETIRYRPDLVITSGDKSSDGTVGNLETWRGLMAPYDRARIPYFAGVGNHDRKANPGIPGGLDPLGSLTNYRGVFAGRPFPFGDAPPIADPRFSPRTRPESDPAGASSHYAFDYANVRFILLDNSCFGIINCDPLQSPSFPDAQGNRSQYDFLARETREAKAAGKRVFVSFHMPTRDPRGPHLNPTPGPHTMGEGTSPDNAIFEQRAAALGIDGVFAGHIKGQWLYRAGGVPYFTDGGAGGEVYVGPGERTGVDYGYWHGFRLVSVSPDGAVRTDAVPIFEPGALEISGPDRVSQGATAGFTAKGLQPTIEGPKVELELREPAAARPNRANLPTPAHIWTTTNPDVLRPVAGRDEDPRRDPVRQTGTGRFEAVCPGRASVVVRAGYDGQFQPVTVASNDGPLVASVRRGARVIRRGRTARIGTVRVAQPVRVLVRIRRGRRTIATIERSCATPAAPLALRWNGNGRRRAALGRYTVQVRFLSDRRPVTRTFGVRTSR